MKECKRTNLSEDNNCQNHHGTSIATMQSDEHTCAIPAGSTSKQLHSSNGNPLAVDSDNDRSTMLNLVKLQVTSRYLIRRLSSQEWTEVDAARSRNNESNGGVDSYSVGYDEICSTALSILMRAVSVYINVRLAYEYYIHGEEQCFIWTVTCIVVPMCITILIHANMCHQDGKFNNGTCKALQTLWLVFISSFLFRYWNSLRYSIKCKHSERNGNKERQLRYYKLMVREESDVAFIRLFECFLEAAPQKILQISIVLANVDKMRVLQIIAICSYFGSMAWCLSAYHRCNRYAQIDKYNISTHGLILQLCWHFCISVSRTLCIAFVASIFPMWILIACLSHALVFGFVTFIVDRPQFAATAFFNYLFCLILGIVYLFTYISVRDGPTKVKYTLYYLVCSIENIICVTLFMLYASSDSVSSPLLFYPLCGMALAFYYMGIVFMIAYYLYFHPKITARTSKRIVNNN